MNLRYDSTKVENAPDVTYPGNQENPAVMGKDDIIARIKARAEAIAALGATALYIYGSRSRGEERPGSDLDVFVDFDPGKFGFVELVELEDMLSRELGLDVQLGTRDALHPLIRPRIEHEAVRVL
jgi:predicted nucleotidyltransferase